MELDTEEKNWMLVKISKLEQRIEALEREQRESKPLRPKEFVTTDKAWTNFGKTMRKEPLTEPRLSKQEQPSSHSIFFSTVSDQRTTEGRWRVEPMEF
jgi:hypothetical protein